MKLKTSIYEEFKTTPSVIIFVLLFGLITGLIIYYLTGFSIVNDWFGNSIGWGIIVLIILKILYKMKLIYRDDKWRQNK